MLREVLQRVAALVPVLLGIAIITFFLIRLVPGDVVDVMLGEQSDPQVAAELRRSFGLDRPLYKQFGLWFGGLLRADLGKSVRGQPGNSGDRGSLRGHRRADGGGADRFGAHRDPGRRALGDPPQQQR